MRGALSLILALFLAVLAIACDDEAAPEPSLTPSPSASPEATASPASTPTVAAETPPAASPSPTAAACAAGSKQRFREVDAEAPWPVYCPTFLPEGYEVEEIIYGLDISGAAPEAGVGAMQAQFVNAQTGGRITFVQGLPGLSVLTSAIRDSEELGDIPYDDFAAKLFRSPSETPGELFLAVLGSSDEITHWIEATGPSEDEMRQIAAGMQPVSP